MHQIYVYLKGNIKDLKGFSSVERRSNNGTKWEDFYFLGFPASEDKSLWKLYVNDFTVLLPDAVKELIEVISLYERIPSIPSRISGIYRYNDAEAELDRGCEAATYGLNMHSKTMESLLALYRLIRAGSITPTENWDSAQVPVIPVSQNKIWSYTVVRLFQRRLHRG